MAEKLLDMDKAEENAEQIEELEEQEQEQEAERAGQYVHAFDPAVTVGEEKVEAAELTFDWDSLTGADHNAACKAALERGVTVVLREFTPSYLTALAQRACTLRDKRGRKVLRYGDLERMKLTDLTKIQDEARRFLRRSGS